MKLTQTLLNSVIVIFLVAAFTQVQARPSARIVGGYQQNISQAPWQVSIGWWGSSSLNNHFCGGSIIGDRWVLTAAHCMFDPETGKPEAGALMITIGSTRLSSAQSHNRYKFTFADNVYLHPQYRTSGFDHDIALIELATPMNLEICGDNCQVIELVTPANEWSTAMLSARAWVSGWGGIHRYVADAEGYPPEGFQQQYTDVLKEVELSIVTCEGMPAKYYSDNMICAAASDMNAEDTCQGDSGGPLSVFNNQGDGFLLAGIVSFGNGCAAGTAGVNTRVSQYVDWINSKKSGADIDKGHDNLGDSPVPAISKSSGGGALGIGWLIMLSVLAFGRSRRLVRRMS